MRRHVAPDVGLRTLPVDVEGSPGARSWSWWSRKQGRRETDGPACDGLSFLIYNMHIVQNQHEN